MDYTIRFYKRKILIVEIAFNVSDQGYKNG